MLSGGLPCYSVYGTADGRHMAVAALEAKFWKTCCEILERPDLIPRHWVTGDEAAAVKAELAAIFATRTRDEWAARFADADCCVTPVLSLEEALANEQAQARGTVFEADGLQQFAPPMKVSEFDFAVERPAPKVGEHSVEILAEAGLQPADIARLQAAGVI
jgi:crotonobetainyl-CoA:carnitine CoA-transferase CaiB-like acyl-CoA transferase